MKIEVQLILNLTVGCGIHKNHIHCFAFQSWNLEIGNSVKESRNISLPIVVLNCLKLSCSEIIMIA